MSHTVLVTGGAGYIGSHAALAFLAAGWSVVIIDNLSTGKRELVPEAATFHQVDIADHDAVRGILRDHNIDAIAHFAGSIVVPESVEKPIDYYRNNTQNSLGLIALAVETGVTAFLFSSTAAVYGMPEVIPIREDAPKLPINPYGASKLMTERMLLDAHAAYGLHVGILRYFNVAGADADGRSGQCTPKATHLIKIVSEVFAGKREQVAVFGTDYPTEDGSCIRDYIHVSDLADAHVLALTHILTAEEPLIANCGYGRGFSVKQVLDVAKQSVNQPLPVVEAPRRAGDPPSLVADNAHIRATLGWQPKHDDLGQMVRSALEWERRLG